MTRINLVHPSRLADQHLFAEWREIKHIPAFLKQLLDKGRTVEEIKAKISPTFTLNKGHKYFFVDKLDYLDGRYTELTLELRRRGIKFEYQSLIKWSEWLHGIPEEFYGNYRPDYIALELSEQRILERIGQRPDWYRYKGEIKDLQFFSSLLNL
jgi:deoxyribonuclease (pyrimidine dimer)